MSTLSRSVPSATTKERKSVSAKTEIAWTDSTWNPVTGCVEVSPGCAHCYAKTFAERWRGVEGHAYEQGFDLTLRPERLDQPSRWTKPRIIFVNSMSDLFHEDIPDEYILRVYREMRRNPRHVFQVLTKRSDRMRKLTAHPAWIEDNDGLPTSGLLAPQFEPYIDKPLDHVWHGVSVENQRFADERIPHLFDVPSAVRFLSCEPLLGPVDLTPWLEQLQWVIVGGESGSKARPMNPHWARDIKDQCMRYGVPFFFKQWGQYLPIEQGNGVFPDRQIVEIDRREYLRLGKNKSGALLDHREWKQMPAALEERNPHA